MHWFVCYFQFKYKNKVPFILRSYIYGYSRFKFGNKTELECKYIDASVKNIIYDIRVFLHKRSFEEYAIFNGTPYFIKAKAIMIHIFQSTMVSINL